MINGGANHWQILGGNAQSGSLATDYDGTRPNVSGYNPMHKQGAIILGIGGDNSKGSAGTFYEGVMTSGFPTTTTENSVQASIVAAGYTTSTTSGGGASGRIVAGDNSSVCVDDNNGSTANGNKVQMWTCDGYAPAQNWTLNSNGSISINGTSSCIDITGANYNNGTPIQLYSCWGGANQQWQAAERGTRQPGLRQMPRRPQLEYSKRDTARPVDLQRRLQSAMDRSLAAPQRSS